MNIFQVNVLLALFGLASGLVAIFMAKDAEGKVPGATSWILSILLFIPSLGAFVFPKISVVVFLAAFIGYVSFWLQLRGFFLYYGVKTSRFYRHGVVLISFSFAFVDAFLVARNPSYRYMVFNGFYAFVMGCLLIWCVFALSRYGFKTVFALTCVPFMGLIAGTVRFCLAILHPLDPYWFGGGEGDIMFRILIFILLVIACLYELRLVNRYFVKAIKRMYETFSSAQKGILMSVAAITDNGDDATSGHVARVGFLTERLALALSWSSDRARMLGEAAQLHDIGKVAITDSILDKEGGLTDIEFEEMKRHTFKGEAILRHSNIPLYRIAANIAMEHHENWDGTGYPRGLAGAEISVESRIVSICDVVDALCRKRCYKSPWTDDMIRDYLVSERGRKFDPLIVDHALKIRLWTL